MGVPKALWGSCLGREDIQRVYPQLEVLCCLILVCVLFFFFPLSFFSSFKKCHLYILTLQKQVKTEGWVCVSPPNARSDTPYPSRPRAF